VTRYPFLKASSTNGVKLNLQTRGTTEHHRLVLVNELFFCTGFPQDVEN